jgi:MSHA biogenesis protein MshN
MSVINQMLVDLEARRAADRPAIEARQTAYTVAGAPRGVRRGPRAIVWVLAVLVLAAAVYAVHRGGYGELLSLLDRAVSSAVASTRDEPDAATPAVGAMPGRSDNPTTHVDPVHVPAEPEQVAVLTPAPVTSATVTSTTPVTPDRSTTAPDQRAAPHREKSAKNPVPMPREKSVEEQAPPEPQPVIAAATARPQPVVQAAVKPDKATSASSPAVEEVQANTGEPAVQIKKVPRKPSPQARFAQYLANARNALAKGDTTTAEKLVRQASNLAPGNAAAAELMIAVQLHRGDTDAAIATLREVLTRDPGNAAYARTLARLLTARGEHQAAIDYLRAALGEGRGDGASLALLAGLERRIGDHESAAAHYVDALAQDRSVAVWWMGLGISLERLHQPAEAHAAFSEAQRIGGLDREVAVFVEQRLARLDAAAGR